MASYVALSSSSDCTASWGHHELVSLGLSGDHLGWKMNGFRLHVHSGCRFTLYILGGNEWVRFPRHSVSGSTLLGLTWDSWCGKGTATGCTWCLRGAMLLRGFRLFGVALHREPNFFFRPTPSWLSPGRSTSLYLPKMNCEKRATPLLEMAAKESKCGPLHSPSICLNAVSHKQKRTKHKQTHNPNKKHQKQKPTQQNTPKNQGIRQWGALTELNSILCAIIRAGHHQRQEKSNTRWPSEGAEATIHVAETQDPPSQDPGDHNVQPWRHDLAPRPCTGSPKVPSGQKYGWHSWMLFNSRHF